MEEQSTVNGSEFHTFVTCSTNFCKYNT